MDTNAECGFHAAKNALMKTPILPNSDSTLPFEVQTDASGIGVGAVLQQKSEYCTRPVAYMSRNLKAAEQNYTVREQGLLAAVDALRDWRPYLPRHKFVVKIDHRPLQYLQTQPQLSRRQARWALFLQEYDFEWDYVSGPSNRAASRYGYSPIHATWKYLHQLAKNGATEGTIALNTKIVVEAIEVLELASQYDSDP
jgi:RNase H-like domain found in reverse transcriptase